MLKQYELIVLLWLMCVLSVGGNLIVRLMN